ncbi:hypothetical protein [Peribacillus muralis]|uniref:hypothetical protein n=1 Tax=Peribacillus muralis TaxID=264697 RepID=UPI00366F1AAD
MIDIDIERKVYTILLNDTDYGELDLLSFQDMVKKLSYRTGRKTGEVIEELQKIKKYAPRFI